MTQTEQQITALTNAAEQALQSGDLFTAYDVAMTATDEGAATTRLHYLATLALARMGATRRAHEQYQSLRLCDDPSTDSRALGARLMKDVAFLATGADRNAHLQAAADRYFGIYQDGRDYFPGINAATLYFLAGDQGRGQALATDLLASSQLRDDASYYGAATRAEALLLLGHDDDAAAVITQLVDLAGQDYGAIATTRRQLKRILAARGIASDNHASPIADLQAKNVAHFCGHMIPPNMSADKGWQRDLAAAFRKHLTANNIGIVYGAIACGADIVFAEAALEAGAALVAVLPFAREDFIAQSVAPGGGDWVGRFGACLARAEAVMYATEDEFVDDPWQFSYGSMMAMGMARLRAQALDSKAIQIAAWDGQPTDYPAGTAQDIAMWQQSGGDTVVIEFTRTPAPQKAPETAPETVSGTAPNLAPAAQADADDAVRVMRSIIFTDFHNFSKLSESKLPQFANLIMGACAQIVDAHDDAIDYRNTWGDALFLIINDVVKAAEIALQLQARIAQVDGAPLGLSGASQMRVGLHHGPVYKVQDPVTRGANYYGSQISRAARVEPITPPGAVYVTESFAAILAMTPEAPYQCSYVGRIDLPKGFGNFRMYQLESVPH